MARLSNYDFVERLKKILNRNDVIYQNPAVILSNKKEFCYYTGTNLLVSPVGVIKSLIYDKYIETNLTKGWYAQWNPEESSIETGWNAYKTFTKSCVEISDSFKSIPYGAMLIMDNSDNLKNTCGIYVGNSKVIEVTNTWNANTIIESHIDTAGNRSYDSTRAGKWLQWGKINEIEYMYSPAEDIEAAVGEEDGTSVVTYEGKVITGELHSVNSGYSPNSLYNCMVYQGDNTIEVRPSYPDLGIYTTVINSGNKYYIGDTSGVCYNNSDKINNRNIEGVNALYYLECLKSQALDRLTFGNEKRSRLANCVGYARGRVFELWGQLIDNKFILSGDTGYVIPAYDNKVIQGDIYIPVKHGSGTHIPNTHAKNFTANWPRVDGFGVGNDPRVGSIACWGSSKYGHVAFVEAVMNRGLKDEYIIVSESGWSKTGAKNVAWTKKIAKNNYLGTYSYASGYNLNGFCYTPLCQVFEDLPTAAAVSGPIVLAWDEVTIEDIEKMYTVNETLANTRVTKELKVGDKVVVEWFGYKDPAADEKDISKRINISGAEGKILKIVNGKPYKYAISTDGKNICGYFDRKALALLEK